MKTTLTFMSILLTSHLCTAGEPANFPATDQGPASIAELLAQRTDYTGVRVSGYIVRRVEKDELFELRDATGSILLKVDHKHWPYPVTVDPRRRIEVFGEFDFEDSGPSKLKVFALRAQP